MIIVNFWILHVANLKLCSIFSNEYFVAILNCRYKYQWHIDRDICHAKENFGKFGESMVILFFAKNFDCSLFYLQSAVLFKVKASVCGMYFWKHFKCILHRC